MKRCPQCEFIYEDEQSHCDMDGARLTHESHLLLGTEALAIRAESADKPRWRKSFVTLSAPLILLTVLTSFYFVSTEETSSTIPQIVSPALIQTFPATVAAPNTPSAERGLSTPSVSTEENSLNDEPDSATTDSEKPEAKRGANRRRERNAISPTPQNSTRPRSSTGNSNDKEDSKVRSALKKTGRFFKKALPL